MAKPNVTGGIVEYLSPGEHLTVTVNHPESSPGAGDGGVTGGMVVELNDDRAVEPAKDQGAALLGVALYDGDDGDKVTVAVEGVFPVVVKGGCNAGELLTSADHGTSNVDIGKAMTASAGDPLVGQALEDIADGDAGRVMLVKGTA